MTDIKFEKINIESLAEKKVQKKKRFLRIEHQEAFVEVFKKIGGAVIWRRFQKHVEDSVNNTSNPDGRSDNIYRILKEMNRLINAVFNWFKRQARVTAERLREYVSQIAKAARSVCRRMDGMATCWDEEARQRLIENG